IASILEQQPRYPLALVGNIGAGKTRILRLMQRGIAPLWQEQRIFADLVVLSHTGYARPSVGGFLIAALERMPRPPECPPGVLPLVWAIANVPTFSSAPRGRVATALREAQRRRSDRQDLAELVSRWLYRQTLTPTQSARVGLYGRLDWEGELISIVGD